MLCLVDLQCQGVVRREVEHFKIYRGIKNFSLLCPLGLLKPFPQKGGSVEAKSKMWDLQMVLVHPTCHTQDLRQPIVLPLRERGLP